MKHTKGPWILVRSPKTPDLVRVGPGVAITDENNAALIAAAPEMLDRLHECLGYLEADNAPEYFIASVKAAIAKAKGKSV